MRSKLLVNDIRSVTLHDSRTSMYTESVTGVTRMADRSLSLFLLKFRCLFCDPLLSGREALHHLLEFFSKFFIEILRKLTQEFLFIFN